MKKLAIAFVLAALVVILPRTSIGQRYWRHEAYGGWHPRPYGVVPVPIVPAPRPVCPVHCHMVNVCNGYGWCHWERHCEPWCY
jgi:hypothetical protein